MQVKICGVRDAASARACAVAGADWAGLNFVPGRRRRVSVEAARGLIPLLGPCRPVGVFLDQAPAEIRAVIVALPLAAVQIHGPIEPGECAAIQALGVGVFRAAQVGPGFDPEALRAYAPVVDAFVLDAASPGSGETFDHARLDGLELGRPALLAGGLDPDNVAAAIARVRPHGVDCASGVERDGWPDPDRIAAFCAAARSVACD